MATSKNPGNSSKVEEVKLLSFSQLQQAYIIKGKLEANGIYCYLTNENTQQVAPHYSVMGVWMDLMINKEDLQSALQILCDGDEQKLLELQGWVFCPKCGSTNVQSQFSKGKILQILAALIAVIKSPSPQNYICNVCKHKFTRA